MVEKQRQILQAASDCFMRYGVKRTTMSEVAGSANVSRPTLYEYYPSKEELLGGVIDYFNDILFNTIRSEIRNLEKLSDKLDVIFDHAVLRVFDLIRSWPDASDVVAHDQQHANDAYIRGLDQLRHLFSSLLLPYQKSIEKSGLTVDQYAAFVVTTATKLKKGLDSRSQLEAHLEALKISVLSVARES